MAEDNYEEALQREGRDLLAAVRANELPPVEYRDDEARAVLEHLERGRSVLLVGPDGVGKTAVVHALARRLLEAAAGRVRGLVQLSTAQMLSGTRYLGEWQTKADKVARHAIARQLALYFSDIALMDSAGQSSGNKTNMLDALRPHVESGKLLLLGEVTPEALRRMERVPGFASLFQRVTLQPLSLERTHDVLASAAGRLGVALDAPSRRAIIDLTSRFLPMRPPPGDALRLLEQVRDYQAEKQGVGEPEPVTPTFVERVFSIYSGLPRFVVSPNVTVPANEMRAWFRERIVGQERAIDAVVEAIALFKAGLHDPTKPIGTFLFVGPTGVGKTELARATATYLFGSPHRLLRFDLSEYKDYHAFETLAGNPRDPDSPARLIDPVRAQPFQVVLLDELEKAHPNVWDLLLPLLDEGHLTSGAGRRTDFRNTLVIATSNVGAAASTRALGFDRQVDAGASIRKALEAEFRPELINRFQHVVVFHALSAAQVRAIARHELSQILQREGIARRNLVVDVDDGALDLVIERGYDPKYGARALKRELQRGIVLPLAMTLMEREVAPGSLLRVSPRDGEIQVRVVDTAESRRHKREQAPIPVADGRKVGRDDLRRDVEAARERVEALARATDEPFLRVERDRLVALRAQPDFWRDAAAAARDVRDLDALTVALDRLEKLRARGEALAQALGQADTRTRLLHASNDLARLRSDTEVAWRELVAMKRDGHWDALVEVRPIGGRMARDLLVETYTRWAAAQQMTVEWLFEPRGDLEPAMFAVQGRYPYGLLRGEAGVHRVRRGDDHDAARVRVAAWTDARADVRFGEGRAVKATGSFGGALRSRLECAGLVLQNARTLAENRALALEVAPSWAAAPPASEAVVRRYDLEPLLVRDVLTDETTGRTDALQPEPFHALLCRRVDAAAES